MGALLDIDALCEQARAVQERAAKATPGPWRWWTSCSFRRLSSDPSGKDGDVAYARVAHDGVPDISIREEDMQFIAAARTDYPGLADAVLRLAEEVRRLSAPTSNAYPAVGELWEDSEDGEVVRVIAKQHGMYRCVVVRNALDGSDVGYETLRSIRTGQWSRIEATKEQP